jgi:hypothetical protein
MMTDGLTKRRLIQNAVIFRKRNQRAERALTNLLDDDEPIQFCCECSDEKCRQHITLSGQQYRELHKTPRQFIVKPGHETVKVEQVITRGIGYWQVEKYQAP